MKNLLRILLALAATTAAFAQNGTAIPGGNQATTYVINKPGTYYLAANRVVTNANINGIEIASDDVTLNLNGCTISYPDNAGAAFGIYGKDIQNTEIRGGSIVSAPSTGIYINSTDTTVCSSNTRIIDVRVSNPRQIGIAVTGNAMTIARCTIDETGWHGISISGGKSALITDCVVNQSNLWGIASNVHGLIIKNCVVTEAKRSGIYVLTGTVEGCQVTYANSNRDSSQGGICVGIAAIVRNNTLTHCFTNSIYVVANDNLIEGNTVVSENPTGAAIGAGGGGKGLMINNRYSKHLTLTNGLTNGGGNIAF